MIDLLTLLENKYSLTLISGVSGVFLTLIAQNILNKRGLFTYFVQHNKVGVSEDNAIFGTVRVTWNDNPIAHLYMSTIELINQSTKDYESVIVRVFTNDTLLLTERTEIAGTTHMLRYTEEYADKLSVPKGQQATQWQQDLFRRQRDYLIPIMNRGQVVQFQFLNAANTETQPTIWLDVLHTGVKLKICNAPNVVHGVPQSKAALMGVIVGLIFVSLVIGYIDTLWIAAISTFLFGLVAQVPGAYSVKAWRKIKELVVG